MNDPEEATPHLGLNPPLRLRFLPSPLCLQATALAVEDAAALAARREAAEAEAEAVLEGLVVGDKVISEVRAAASAKVAALQQAANSSAGLRKHRRAGVSVRAGGNCYRRLYFSSGKLQCTHATRRLHRCTVPCECDSVRAPQRRR